MEQPALPSSANEIILPSSSRVSLLGRADILRFFVFCLGIREVTLGYSNIEHADLLWHLVWTIDDDVLGCEEDSGKNW